MTVSTGVVYSGVASTSLRHLLSGGTAAGSVLGASSHAVWLLFDGDVVVISTTDATRLPNGIEIPLRAETDPFGSVGHGDSAVIGESTLTVGRITVEVRRWWDPRPALGRLTPAALDRALSGLPDSVEGLDSTPVRAAALRGDTGAVIAAVSALLGRGDGLTPEGDDLIAGFLVAVRSLGDALGCVAAGRLIDDVSGPISDLAATATTSFSADLIECAARGEAAAPAGAFLRALADRGDVADTHRSLLAVGHSSGPALAAGIVLGGLTLVDLCTDPPGGTQ